ncbi:hypothetical protein [Nocardioides sp. YIM 152588]|uniref:hypothetical protein n=1 Tax=Nocardioides sp. YIM 152588 TaxID=3158259 RepID=UPI0032E410B0
MRSVRADAPRRSRRPLIRPAVGGVVLAAVVATGCTDPYVAPTPTPSAGGRDEDAAAATVAALGSALAAGDRAGAADLGANRRAGRRLAAAAGNVVRADMADVGVRYLGASGAPDALGRWTATMQVTWRYRGFDDGVARREVEVGLAADSRSITHVGGGREATPLWLARRLVVARGPSHLVLAEGSRAGLGRLARLTRVAARQVAAVLGGAPRIVVEAPASSASLHRALGADPPLYAEVAAVTAPVDGSLAADAPVHVLINPGVFYPLGELAAQVVVTHEGVHAVTRAPLAVGAPLWLVEGFADYVALRDVDLPYRRTAGQVIERLRADGLPDQLPTQADFTGSAEHLGAQYEAAWLACVTIADRKGEEALVELYRQVLDGRPLEAALRRTTGWSTERLTDAWRARLAALAGLSE